MNDEAGDAMLIPSTTKLLNVLHNKDDLGWRATAAEAQTAHCNAAAVWWGWGDGSEGSNLTTTPTEPLFNSISSLPPFSTICAPPHGNRGHRDGDGALGGDRDGDSASASRRYAKGQGVKAEVGSEGTGRKTWRISCWYAPAAAPGPSASGHAPAADADGYKGAGAE